MDLLKQILAAAGIASLVCAASAAVSFEHVMGKQNAGHGSVSRTVGHGIADEENVPAGRSKPITWVDLNGNTWIYGGGQRFLTHSDMWMLDADTADWTWVRGSLAIPMGPTDPVYGTKGVPDPANHPGSRGPTLGVTAISWTDASGDLWFLDNLELWKYNIPSNQWTWVETFPETTNHGVQGVPDPANAPGARIGAVTWRDGQGDLWLFGGSQYTDVWKYDIETSLWTWVHGSKVPDPHAVYGVRGVAADANHPGSRTMEFANWVDSSNNLWLFGGRGYGASEFGIMNDMWKFDTSTHQWTYMSGSSSLYHSGNYGVKGSFSFSNSPAARVGAQYWTGLDGYFYLFSGHGSSHSPVQYTGYHSDLWKFDPVAGQWAWIDGPQFSESINTIGSVGEHAESNIPASRIEAGNWISADGKLWMFGGYYGGSPVLKFNDLWSYDFATEAWAYYKGALEYEEKYHHGVQNVATPANTPGARLSGVTWRDHQGNLWLFGGRSPWYIFGSFAISSDRYYMYDLWKFNPTNDLWSWEKGSYVADAGGGPPAADYGQQGVEAPSNLPSGRVNAVSWVDDAGLLWMFGGQPKGFSANNYLSDLWRYNQFTNNWTWMSGSSEIGDKGHLDPTNPKPYPNARTESLGWKDASGDLWMFGGYSADFRRCTNCDIITNPGWRDDKYHNDLWRYDTETNQWIVESLGDFDVLIGDADGTSDRVFGGYGVYESKGSFSPVAKPGGRRNAYSWTDTDGNFWLFGGYGLGASEVGLLHDLWKFNPVTKQWAWVSGTGAVNQASQFGPLEEASPLNLPGGNQGGVAWLDQDSNLLLMGGNQWSEEHPNVIWKFDVASGNWSWTEHPTDPSLFSNIDTPKGQASVENFPGLRYEAMAWNDPNGTLWLFGGDGFSQYGQGLQGDMWKTQIPPPATASGWELYE